MEIRRKVKNAVYKYSEPERLVREATSNDPWGPTSTVMSEISNLTYDYCAFEEIMQLIWKRLNDKGKNWRHVYKCLVLLDYLIKCGDKRVATLCIDNIHAIDTLKDFQYFEEHKDFGLGIREKSKTLVSLLRDEEVLNIEREKGQKVKEKFQGPTSAIGSHQRRRPGDLGKEIRKQYDRDARFPKSVMKLNFDETKNEDEDEDLQKAIALSKEEHEKSMQRKIEEERIEDMKIKMALEQSKKEDETVAALKPPPKTSDLMDIVTNNNSGTNTVSDHIDNSGLYKLGEASRVLDEMNGFNDLDHVEKYDPWGSPNSNNNCHDTTLSLDFDPWKTDSDFHTATVASKGTTNNVWSNQRTVQQKNFIDDIFGEDKPSIHFETSFMSDIKSPVHTTNEDNSTKLMDVWMESSTGDNFHSTKNITGSLASLTDIGINHQEEIVKHSCSVMNLAPSRMKKTPQEFLGENASLVNLENLLPTPKAGVYRDSMSYAQKNPFDRPAATVTVNPFNNNNNAHNKTPMNAMTIGNSKCHMFSSSGNLSSNNINNNHNYNNNINNFNSFSQMTQPIIANTQSQYRGFQNTSSVYNTGNGFWGPQPAAVPANNQWNNYSNNAALNPFY